MALTFQNKNHSEHYNSTGLLILTLNITKTDKCIRIYFVCLEVVKLIVFVCKTRKDVGIVKWIKVLRNIK